MIDSRHASIGLTRAFLFMGKYQHYLDSDHWKKRRKQFLDLDANKCCRVCKREKRLQVHHMTYENIGNEKDEDLVVFCSRCHKKFHKKHGTENLKLNTEAFIRKESLKHDGMSRKQRHLMINNRRHEQKLATISNNSNRFKEIVERQRLALGLAN